jgi:predicted cation transporter
LVRIFIALKNLLISILGERVDTSIFCSSAIKSNLSINELNQPEICLTPYTEPIKDIQSENQIIENVCCS